VPGGGASFWAQRPEDSISVQVPYGNGAAARRSSSTSSGAASKAAASADPARPHRVFASSEAAADRFGSSALGGESHSPDDYGVRPRRHGGGWRGFAVASVG